MSDDAQYFLRVWLSIAYFAVAMNICRSCCCIEVYYVELKQHLHLADSAFQLRDTVDQFVYSWMDYATTRVNYGRTPE